MANVPNSPILVTLMMEAQSSFETSVLATATRRNIPGDDILHSHRRENLKSYTHVFVVVFCAVAEVSLRTRGPWCDSGDELRVDSARGADPPTCRVTTDITGISVALGQSLVDTRTAARNNPESPESHSHAQERQKEYQRESSFNARVAFEIPADGRLRRNLLWFEQTALHEGLLLRKTPSACLHLQACTKRAPLYVCICIYIYMYCDMFRWEHVPMGTLECPTVPRTITGATVARQPTIRWGGAFCGARPGLI
jgi:hypothetical protein